jgi:NADH-quinone oxidoreductase subunit J
LSADLALFYALAALTVLAAVGVVAARNVMHAVLCMVAHFALTAVLFLTLHAPFIAIVQVAVYAGAIMVLFLFVVMLLGREDADFAEPRREQRWLGVPLVAALAALLVFVVREGVPAALPGATSGAAATALPADFGSPAAIGDVLFRYHVLSFEIVSVLLLVGVLGAVVIARPGRSRAAGGEGGGGGDE